MSYRFIFFIAEAIQLLSSFTILKKWHLRGHCSARRHLNSPGLMSVRMHLHLLSEKTVNSFIRFNFASDIFQILYAEKWFQWYNLPILPHAFLDFSWAPPPLARLNVTISDVKLSMRPSYIIPLMWYWYVLRWEIYIKLPRSLYPSKFSSNRNLHGKTKNWTRNLKISQELSSINHEANQD